MTSITTSGVILLQIKLQSITVAIAHVKNSKIYNKIIQTI